MDDVGDRSVEDEILQIIPPLDGSLHKGQSGRVGVLGGALDYTGAPFFAAISAQRVGVDLSHVICSPTAANAIKSYSPDLIVHPILREETPPDSLRPELAALLSRLHVLVIGPGLGREEYMQTFARLALEIAKEQGMFLVIDADGLYTVGGNLDLIRGYRRAVLTPNIVEFKRLSELVGIDPDTRPEDRASLVSKGLGGVTVLQKGKWDTIAVNTEGAESRAVHKTSKISPHEGGQKEVIIVNTPGGLKRCGGQGDILSGSVGAFLAWAKCYESGAFGDNAIPVSRMPILAAVGASMVTRTTSRRAFEEMGRAVVTQDMLSKIGGAFVELFGSGDVEVAW
ncbi:Ribokinase-like protein [Russula ochroleuca]|uniref:ATP-dependent (S)-NAD(P)H-hydrate dehydratase n=1 Tax=Russula ochroleuca TaxID=152965 RepID=A0A9P5T906_9AGAM|nr:Ribokinase-like protein [Russula ochroleuca]